MNKKILYVTSSLPSVTLTFIYREINILIKSGYDIGTVSRLKPDIGSVSSEALDLYESTLYLDQVSLFFKCLCQLCIFFSMPVVWFKTALLSLKEKEIKGFRDRLRLIKQLLDAGYAYTQVKGRNYQHIHAHFLSGPTSVAVFLSKYLNISFSFTMHASLIFIDPIMLRTKLEMCKRAVTISEYNKRYLLKKYGPRLADKIDIIHCGLDLSSFTPAAGPNPSPPIILAVGQLVERKGFIYLVEALRILKKTNMPFCAYIVGDGEQRNLLDGKIKDYGLSETVHLLGRQPQEKVRVLLEQASIFTLPSVVTDFGGREGIPVALMEAMAMQLPVISTKSVGIPELISDGEDGILVDECDAEQLSSAMAFLLENPEIGAKMGIKARKRIEKDFNIDSAPFAFRSVFC